ncbi:nitroreductase family protein [Desulfovibrio oxyclinae]|jgi:nitroreductase|uniref:nitroreductase family protein n=1 Tax=Desulfovibrio oxyclinae TaxID=63560 RepID=UPI000369322E|nr:nitroreductase family protein [Desulfovibrio oxyclinae]
MLEDFIQLVAGSRTYRRFREDERIAPETLRSLVRAASLTPSAGNLQPLRYVLVGSKRLCDRVFDSLGWAAYLESWPGPAEGQRPAAYIVICSPKGRGAPKIDVGIAAQTVMLAAHSAGLGGCMIGSFDAKRVARILEMEDEHDPLLVLALGVPDEKVVMEPLPNGGDVRYWRDSEGVHHVPKRAPEDLVIRELF